MQQTTADPDAIVAELLERLGAVADLTEACSIVLERAATVSGVGRAFVAVRGERGLIGCEWGLDAHHTSKILRAADENGSAIVDAIAHLKTPAARRGDWIPELGFSACYVSPFPGIHSDSNLGVLILEVAERSEAVDTACEIFRRCGPTLGRILQIDGLTDRVRRINRQRDLLTTMLHALPDPVLLTTEGNDIILANKRAEDLMTVTPEDSDGRRRAVQVNNLLFSSFLTQTVIGTGRASSRELNLVDTHEGSDLLFEVLTIPLDNGTDVISVLRDITDLKHAVGEVEVQYNRSRVAEHEARQERDRLNMILENVSDPILVTDEHSNIILMNSEADRLFVSASGPVVTDDTVQHLIQSNDTRFTTLISNFLLRTDRRQMERVIVVDPETREEVPAEVVSSKIFNARGEPTAIVSVLHDLTQSEENERLARELQQLNEQLEDRIRQATIELEERNRRLEWQSYELQKASRLKSEFLANMSHELRTPINTDRTKVKQVLLNLLSNAIKFTQEGCVTVRVTAAGPNRVRFNVEDTGIGIKPEDVNAIFDDFRQIDQSHTKEYGGTGLGLSITKKLLTLLQGSISVESTYGSGTRFVVELPSIGAQSGERNADVA